MAQLFFISPSVMTQSDNNEGNLLRESRRLGMWYVAHVLHSARGSKGFRCANTRHGIRIGYPLRFLPGTLDKGLGPATAYISDSLFEVQLKNKILFQPHPS